MPLSRKNLEHKEIMTKEIEDYRENRIFMSKLDIKLIEELSLQ